jgi:ribonuclease Y
MGLPAVYLVNAIVTGVIGGSLIVWWLSAIRSRAQAALAAATADAGRIVRQADRDAESIRKEAAIEAREKAHALTAESERLARERRDEITALDQGLADRTRALADRLASTSHLEQALRAREAAVAEHERAAAQARARADEAVAERQRELQRVAGLTADEARDVLLKGLEADARREAANLVKRLEAEARETAAIRAQVGLKN